MVRSRITEDQIVDEAILSEAEHDAWVHTNLVCSGTVNIQDAPVMLSGTGDIYCKDLHTEDNSIYIGETKLSADGSGNLLVDDEPISSSASTVSGTTTSGFSGVVPVITAVTTSGQEYVPPDNGAIYFNFDNTAVQGYLIFEDGLLKLVTTGGQVIFSSGEDADNLLSIL